jgi:hypothetical protein
MSADELRILVDRQAIVDLVHSYCRGVDSVDETALNSCFAEECVVDYGPGMGGPRRGRDVIVSGLVAGLPNFAATHHQVSNIEIRFDDADVARGVTYVTAWHRYSDGRPDAILWGQYHDRFVRTSEGWRIAERILFATGQQNFDIPWRLIPRRGRDTHQQETREKGN